MAKISARGAKEVCRLTSTFGHVFVLTDDRRVLVKRSYDRGYTVHGQLATTRTLNEEGLRGYMARYLYEVA